MSELKKNYDLRKAFVDTLMELAEKDDKIVFIIPDVGFSFIERFKEKYPNRFFNFGVTEQSTMIISAGMALQGFKPYVYSMINFVAFRPFEMIRNAVVMHKANVKILGVKGSDKYKFLGFSHNMLFEDEDTYHLKKYLYCATPQTDEEVKQEVINTYNSNKPAYIRL
jgi:transketolase